MIGSGSEASVIAIVGPTASGKSALAERLALQLGTEVISADSMQVYRGMDIGTAKPAKDSPVRYHCIDLVDPGAHYSAALFQRDARRAIADVSSRGMAPLVAGGTGLYVRAALDDWIIPTGDTMTPGRLALEEEAARVGSLAMHEKLSRAEPAAAKLIHPNNVRRTIRALEMIEAGVSYADQAAAFAERKSFLPTRYIGLDVERTRLYSRIDARVDAMLDSGLLHEVEALLEAGFRDALTASQAIGYKELVGVLDGAVQLEDAIEQVKRATRRYAKRQLTWFRADPRIQWIEVSGLEADAVFAKAMALLSSL